MTVVVPVHSGPEGEAALNAGIAYVREIGGRLLAVLHRPSSQISNEDLDQEIDDLSMRLEAEEIAFTVVPNTRSEDLAALISGTAKTEAASLIIVGLSEASNHGKLVLGTQVQRLLLEAPCAVLVVREGQVLPQPQQG